ncbi:MAG: outer membrane protein assembly factor BamA, partial [Bdellovibrionales bacterium]|nr:outer membrane protein assembly factor BamA [Bdellovibrionales bacterium]
MQLERTTFFAGLELTIAKRRRSLITRPLKLNSKFTTRKNPTKLLRHCYSSAGVLGNATRIIAILLSLFILISANGKLSAQENASRVFQIDGVLIEGNRNVDTAAIKKQLSFTAGSISAEQIADEVKLIYETQFFDQVTASLVKGYGSENRSMLKYELVEKPLVRKVFIKGNEEIEDGELSKILSFGSQRFLDKTKADALVKAARIYYQSQGYYDAELEYSVVPVGDGQVDITFSVDEGDRIKIRDVSVRGVREVDEDDLLDEIETSDYSWWSSWLLGTGRLNRETLEADKVKMRQFFLDNGFVEATVGEPAIERKEDGIYVTFYVEEGEQYDFGEIEASGDLIEGDQGKTLEGLKSETGDTFSAAKLRDDAFRVSDKFSDVGYAYVNVVPNTRIDRSAHKVDVNFEVNKGDKVKVRRIIIKGNNKTYDNVIRREMQVDEQDYFSSSKIRRSQELLQRSGYYEEVTISNEPTDQKDQVDLLVNVREGSTGSFSAGAGYSSAEGALFNVRVTERNLFGTGRSANLNLDVGDERNNIILSVDDPRLNDSHLALGVDLLRTDREFSDFDRVLEGGSVVLGYPLEEVFGESFEDISASMKYELLSIEISDVDPEDAAQLVIDSEGESTSSGITPRIRRNTLNHPYDPTDGSLQEVSFEVTGLGGDEEYWQAEGRQSLYYPLLESE